jgi:hypothetical protein
MKNKWKIIAIVFNFSVGTILFMLHLIHVGVLFPKSAAVAENVGYENIVAEVYEEEDILPKADDYYEDTNNEDNSWLIGKWGPITMSGGTFSDIIESITMEIEIVDDNTLIEKSRTKLTPLGIRTSKSKGTYTGDITESRETSNYTVDNENNELIYNTDPEKRNRQAYEMRTPFDKTNQTLNMGTKDKPMYMRKQTSATDNSPNTEETVLEIAGIWQDTENEYGLPSIQLNDNGSAYYDISDDCSSNGTYTLKGNSVSFTGKLKCSDGDNGEYWETFTIKGSTLLTKNGSVLTKRK